LGAKADGWVSPPLAGNSVVLSPPPEHPAVNTIEASIAIRNLCISAVCPVNDDLIEPPEFLEEGLGAGLGHHVLAVENLGDRSASVDRLDDPFFLKGDRNDEVGKCVSPV
jgi:hypothetical protein